MQRTVHDETNITCCGSNLSVALEPCFRGALLCTAWWTWSPRPKPVTGSCSSLFVSYAGDNLLLNVFFSACIFAAPDSQLVPSCAKWAQQTLIGLNKFGAWITDEWKWCGRGLLSSDQVHQGVIRPAWNTRYLHWVCSSWQVVWTSVCGWLYALNYFFVCRRILRRIASGKKKKV